MGLDDDPVSTFEQVKKLPYLQAVIDETLRIHSTSGIGLPRLVPEGGLVVNGKTFPEGTVLSVPSYTIHRDKEVWGEDADFFNPERWFERDSNLMQKAYNQFSFGPRYVLALLLHIFLSEPISAKGMRWPKSCIDGASYYHLVTPPSVRICSRGAWQKC